LAKRNQRILSPLRVQVIPPNCSASPVRRRGYRPAVQAMDKAELAALTNFGDAADDFGADDPHSLH
jgi:hypothetical protein